MLSPTTMAEEQLTSSQEEGEEQDLLGTQDNDLVVFKMVTVDGVHQYECTACGKSYKAKNSVRSHITRVHKKQKEKESSSVGKETEDAPFDMRRLDRWRSSTQQEVGDLVIGEATTEGLEESFNEEDEPVGDNVIEEEAEKEETIETVKQDLLEVKTKLKSMEEQNNIMENKAKEDAAKNESLEQALEANKQLFDMSQAKVNSLEMDVEEKKEAIAGFQDVFKQMEATIKVFEDAAEKNVNPITEKTLKTLKDEVKAKKKEADDANKRANDAMKKLKDETNARSVAQAEVIRITKTSQSQAKVIEMLERAQGGKTGEKRRRSRSEEGREVRRKRSKSPLRRGRGERSPVGRTGRRSSSQERRRSKEVCWDFVKKGGCNYGQRCKYYHPKEKEVQVIPRSGSRERGGRRSQERSKSREGRSRRIHKEHGGRNRSRSREPRGRTSRSKDFQARRSKSKELRHPRSRSKSLCRDLAKPGGCSGPGGLYEAPQPRVCQDGLQAADPAVPVPGQHAQAIRGRPVVPLLLHGAGGGARGRPCSC